VVVVVVVVVVVAAAAVRGAGEANMRLSEVEKSSDTTTAEPA
jgi:hypothetical protein